MNSTPRLLLAACALLAGTLSALEAAIVISDASTCYNAENWYGYRSNANVSFTEMENSIQFKSIDSSSYVWGYFSPVSLSVGKNLHFTGTFTFGAIASNGKFAFGLFNSGLCSQSEMITHTYQSKTDVSGMKNYSEEKSATGTAMGGMTGISANNEKAYLRSNASSDTAFLSTASGAQQKTETFSSAFTAPTEGTGYAVDFKLTRTADTTLELSVAFNGETAQTVSFETDISTFDVIGIRAPTTASGSGITLTNFSVSTTGTIVPEPSAFGLLAGLGALALVASRRRRKA